MNIGKAINLSSKAAFNFEIGAMYFIKANNYFTSGGLDFKEDKYLPSDFYIIPTAQLQLIIRLNKNKKSVN